MKWILLLLLALLAGALGYWLLLSPSAIITINRSAPAQAEPAPVPASPASAPAPEPASTPAPAPPASAGPLPTVARPPATASASATLLLPVQGLAMEQLADTFTQARGEGRLHDAIDIMAAEGTPVLAVADGTVEKLFTSDRGGLTLYQFEPSGRYAYYYAHLQRYADGIAEGQPLRQGQVLGYVGSTGNANPDAPHLHFAIFQLGPERRWWEGTALNPYPVLRGEQALPR